MRLLAELSKHKGWSWESFFNDKEVTEKLLSSVPFDTSGLDLATEGKLEKKLASACAADSVRDQWLVVESVLKTTSSVSKEVAGGIVSAAQRSLDLGGRIAVKPILDSVTELLAIDAE